GSRYPTSTRASLAISLVEGPTIARDGSLSRWPTSAESQPRVTTVSLFNRQSNSPDDAAAPALAAGANPRFSGKATTRKPLPRRAASSSSHCRDPSVEPLSTARISAFGQSVAWSSEATHRRVSGRALCVAITLETEG